MRHEADAITLLEHLDPDELRTILDRLEREHAAIMVLLRAARARDRKRASTCHPLPLHET
jgi:hypothetical protein